MFHACVKRFDVMGGRGNILSWDGEVNKAIIGKDCGLWMMQSPCDSATSVQKEQFQNF
jgi:hypothetical protein